MKEVSVIIPYCNEYPQILFTVQNIIEELGGLDYEIITVANQNTDQGYERLQNARYVKEGVLKNVKFDDKLGHWNAKNAGVKLAEGKRLLFIDSHVIVEQGSIRRMLEAECGGTLHMQVCYMLDSKRLIYRVEESEMGYRFRGAPTDKTEPYQVPVMSCCGMMVEAKTLEEAGVWNTELGIYGGGENYMIYKLATMGYPIMIHPKATVFHYADKRGYSWNYDDYVRNQFIAAYCVGGGEWLDKLVAQRKTKKNSNKVRIDEIASDVKLKCLDDRCFIKSKQKISMTEYFKRWE